MQKKEHSEILSLLVRHHQSIGDGHEEPILFRSTSGPEEENHECRWPRLENFRYMLRSGMMGWLTVMQNTNA